MSTGPYVLGVSEITVSTFALRGAAGIQVPFDADHILTFLLEASAPLICWTRR